MLYSLLQLTYFTCKLILEKIFTYAKPGSCFSTLMEAEFHIVKKYINLWNVQADCAHVAAARFYVKTIINEFRI